MKLKDCTMKFQSHDILYVYIYVCVYVVLALVTFPIGIKVSEWVSEWVKEIPNNGQVKLIGNT